MKNEYANGYKIVKSVCFDNGGGVALGIYPKSAFPLATWNFTEQDGKKMFYCGYYFALDDTDSAKLDYDRRVKKYKAENPGVAEKCNYLAFTEVNDDNSDIDTSKLYSSLKQEL